MNFFNFFLVYCGNWKVWKTRLISLVLDWAGAELELIDL